MTYTGINIDPGDDTTQGLGGDVIATKFYQAVKLIDPTVDSVDPIGVDANPQHVTTHARTASSATENVVTIDNNSGNGRQILAALSTRKAGEVRVHINATQGIYIALAASISIATARLYAPGERIPLSIGGVVYTGAVFGIIPSGSETVEYTVL